MLTQEREKEIEQSAISHYGKRGQTIVAIEELSELTKELCKFLRCEQDESTLTRIAEEIADCEIMLDQLKMIFENNDDVLGWKEFKLRRLEQRVKIAKGEINARDTVL